MNYITGTLEDITRDVNIPWDPSSKELIITTDSTTGSKDVVMVNFYTGDFNIAGSVTIKFNSPIQYSLGQWCSSSYSPLPITPPDEVEKTWRIWYDQQEQALAVWCNDVKVLDVILSGDGCDSYTDWVWTRETVKIQFVSGDTASDQYCMKGKGSDHFLSR